MKTKWIEPSALWPGHQLETPPEESFKLGRRHLAGSHDELAMFDGAETRDVAGDRHRIGGICEDHRRLHVTHECRVVRRLERVAAEHAVVTEDPEIADGADCRAGDWRRNFVGRVRGIRGIECLDPEIDLRHRKPRRLDREVEIETREVFERLAEQPLVPGRSIGEPVAGNGESARLRLAQMLKRDRRHLGPAEKLAGFEPAVTGDDLQLAVDEDRRIEAEGLDALRNLADLPLIMRADIPRIGEEGCDRPVDDRDLQGCFPASFVAGNGFPTSGRCFELLCHACLLKQCVSGSKASRFAVRVHYVDSF